MKHNFAGFREVSDGKGADGRMFVHETLPLAIWTEDDLSEPTLNKAVWDDKENEKARTCPTGLVFLMHLQSDEPVPFAGKVVVVDLKRDARDVMKDVESFGMAGMELEGDVLFICEKTACWYVLDGNEFYTLVGREERTGMRVEVVDFIRSAYPF